VQVPGRSSSDVPVTIGKALVDMAQYCGEQTSQRSAMLPIQFKVGGTTTGYLKIVVTTVCIGDAGDDAMTDASGVTGRASEQSSLREQDLDGEDRFAGLGAWLCQSARRGHLGFRMQGTPMVYRHDPLPAHSTCPGFHDDEGGLRKSRSRGREDRGASAGTSSRSSKPEGRANRRPLPPMAEEGSEGDDAPAPSARPGTKKKPAPPDDDYNDDNPFAKKKSAAPAPKRPPKGWEDDEDVSPLDSDVEVRGRNVDLCNGTAQPLRSTTEASHATHADACSS
jgi:hypothetical protein